MFIWRISKNDDEFVSIPFLSWYEINGHGVIREKDTNEIIPSFRRTVSLLGKEYDIPRLICIAHKNILIDAHLINLIEVMYVDGDENNWTVDNLVYRFAAPRYMTKYPKHRVIPGYTRYGISHDGEVVELRTGRICGTYFAKDMYVTVYLKHDCRQEGANRLLHRMWALAWLKYPAMVDRMHVNHINTNRHDYEGKNLEWSTHSGNLLHAVDQGLFSSARGVDVWDTKKSTTTSYPSIHRAAKGTGVSGGKIKRGADHGMLFDGRWVVKYSDDKTPWTELADLTVKTNSNAARCVTIIAADGSETTVESQAAAARQTGMSLASVQERIAKFPGKLGRKGYGFKHSC